MQFFLNLVTTRIQTQIVDYLLLYGILCAFTAFLNYLTFMVKHDFSSNIKLKFVRQQWTRYDKLNSESKLKSSLNSFDNLLTSASDAKVNFYAYGLPMICNVVSSLIGFLYVTLFSHQQYGIPLVFIVVHCCCYFFLTKKKIENTDTNMNNNRIQQNKLVELGFLAKERLYHEETTVDIVMDIENELEGIHKNTNSSWVQIGIIQNIPNFMLIIFIALLIDKELYIVMYIICTNIQNSISEIFGFVTMYKMYINDVKMLDDFFNEKQNKVVTNDKNIPSELVVSGMIETKSTNKKNYDKIHNVVNNITIIQILNNITITQGDKILITGKSGSGKTTLINGILGNVCGLKFSSGDDPISYKHQLIYMSQNAGKKFSVSAVTIRNLFYDEYNNNLITEALDLVELSEWYDKHIGNFDTNIEGRISGGQTTRLRLAVYIYKAIKHKSRWIILDEPDAGLDQELSRKIIGRIFDYFSDVTIFLVVHLCKCKIKTLGIKKEWDIDNDGIVTQKYFSNN